MNRIELPGRDAVGIRANNPSAFTLTGTNTWIVGREPAWVIDPGPDLTDHLDAISEEIDARGGLGAVVLTHGHHDHTDAVPALVTRFSPVPVASARVPANLPGATSVPDNGREHWLAPAASTHGPPPHIELHDGDQIGPLHVIAVPGHAADHLVFVTEDGVAYSGDAVLGEGSVFVAAQMAEYLDGLARVREVLAQMAPDPERAISSSGVSGPEFATISEAGDTPVIAPGHGPLVTDADAKLAEYIAHRLEREERLLGALDDGLRGADELLDRAWDDAPAELRVPAGWTLAAHLDKLRAEGRVPDGVEWPPRPDDIPQI
jgi:glyoxylase-like metal-dependent hydrolase (beta-lactamase superfamily II)